MFCISWETAVCEAERAGLEMRLESGGRGPQRPSLLLSSGGNPAKPCWGRSSRPGAPPARASYTHTSGHGHVQRPCFRSSTELSWGLGTCKSGRRGRRRDEAREKKESQDRRGCLRRERARQLVWVFLLADPSPALCARTATSLSHS